MAENLVVAPAGSGVAVAADELASFKGNPNVIVQYVKLLDGTDNSVIPIIADALGNLMVNIAGYGQAVRCSSYNLGAVATTLRTIVGGAAYTGRKNVMIMNIGTTQVLLGDATTQAWPLDPMVPFIQDWAEGVDTTVNLKSSSGTNTIVVLETK